MENKYYLAIGIIIVAVVVVGIMLISSYTNTISQKNSEIQTLNTQIDQLQNEINELSNKTEDKLLNLEFSSKSCEDTDQSKVGIVKDMWWDNFTRLEVKAYVQINCAESILSGDYEIRNNKIILKYEKTNCDICTTCECVHELNFTLTNLNEEYTKYNIIIWEYLN